MSSAKLALACAAAALVLSACGSAAKPLAGTPNILSKPGLHGAIDDPRTAKSNRITCLRDAHFPLTLMGKTRIQVGTLPSGPTIDFDPTPGAAQAQQIYGDAQGAEVIGSALLYPNGASDSQLQAIENCLAAGVSG